jgi:hypothetical protein
LGYMVTTAVEMTLGLYVDNSGADDTWAIWQQQWCRRHLRCMATTVVQMTLEHSLTSSICSDVVTKVIEAL